MKKNEMSSMYFIKNEVLYLIPQTFCKSLGNAIIDVDHVLELKLPTSENELYAKLQECFSLCCTHKVKEFPKGLSVMAKYIGAKTEKQVVSKYDFMSLFFDNKLNKYRLIHDWEKEKNYYLNGIMQYVDEKTLLSFILNIIQDKKNITL